MMKNWKKYTLAMCGFGLVSFGMLGGVSAQDCEQDSDCGDGMICEIYGGTSVACPEPPPCDEGDDCPDDFDCVEEEPEVFGECVPAPIECDTDADCPDYLTCQSHGGGEDALPPCVEDEEGNLDCPEELDEPVEEGSICVYEPIDCQADSDCPSDFECLAIGSSGGACPDIACIDGEDCPEIECEDEEPQEIFACVPQQIECETSDQCPSDWSCMTFSQTTCEGGGAVPAPDDADSSEGSEGGGGEDEEARPEEAPEEDPIDCVEESMSLCVPPGFVGVDGDVSIGGGDFEENDNSPTDSPQDDSDGQAQDVEDEDAGGCSVGTSSRGTGNSGLMIMLAGFIFMATRRRRQS